MVVTAELAQTEKLGVGDRDVGVRRLEEGEVEVGV